jgi:hypothetical protein
MNYQLASDKAQLLNSDSNDRQKQNKFKIPFGTKHIEQGCTHKRTQPAHDICKQFNTPISKGLMRH